MSNSSRLCAALPQYRGRPSQSGDKYIFFQVFMTGKSVQRCTKSASFLRARSSQEKRVPKIYEMYKFLCFFPPGLRNPTLCYQRIYDLIAGERKPGTSPFFPRRESFSRVSTMPSGDTSVCVEYARGALVLEARTVPLIRAALKQLCQVCRTTWWERWNAWTPGESCAKSARL